MKIPKFITIITTIIFAFIYSIAPVIAAPGVAKSAVNVRSGPGTSFSKIDVLYAGEKVTITQCKGNWCYVKHPGPDGWVSKNYLAPATGGSSSADAAALAAFAAVAGAIIGGVITSSTAPKVCFFNGFNYTGSSFCANAGSTNNQIVGWWNNKISSLKVFGGASAKLCKNYFYGGGCQTYNSNKPSLPASMNNKASSYVVF